jgi:hypothetical protein
MVSQLRHLTLRLEVKILKTLIHVGVYDKIKRQMDRGNGGFPPGGFPGGTPPPPFGPFEVPHVVNVTHKSNITIINPSDTNWALLGQNKSVILSPESVDEPFCMLKDKKLLRSKEANF